LRVTGFKLLRVEIVAGWLVSWLKLLRVAGYGLKLLLVGWLAGCWLAGFKLFGVWCLVFGVWCLLFSGCWLRFSGFKLFGVWCLVFGVSGFWLICFGLPKEGVSAALQQVAGYGLKLVFVWFFCINSQTMNIAHKPVHNFRS